MVRKKLLAWWKNILSVFIGSVIVTASEGIIGNRADNLFTIAWPFVQTMIIAILLSWYIVMPVLSSCIIICILFIIRSQMLKHALTIGQKLLKIDEMLLLGMASWAPSLSIEEEKKRIIMGVLLDAISEFDGQIQRAAILLPDVTGDHLYCWANYQMSQDSVDNMKFYIGADQRRRQREGGVAGEVFITGELKVGHLRQVNGVWDSEDCPHYMKFPGRRPFPPYRSFVNIPLIGSDSNASSSSITTCLGVICFDSMSKDVFDEKACQVVLSTFARRVTAALLIFNNYQNLTPPQGNSNP